MMRSLPDIAEDVLLDRACNWLARHPRITAAFVCSLCLLPLVMDGPR